MSIGFDGLAFSGNSTGSNLSFDSHAIAGVNRGLLVYVMDTSVSSVTYSGVAMSFVGASSSVEMSNVELWGLIAPATGANTVAITLGSSSDVAAVAISFTGVNQTTLLRAFDAGDVDKYTVTGTSHNHSIASSTGSLVVDFMLGQNGFPGMTMQTGQTSLLTMATHGIFNYAVSTKPGASSVTSGWDFPAGDFYRWVHFLASLNEEPAAVGQPTMRRWGGVPHVGLGGAKGSSGGGPWGRSPSDRIIVPRWLSDQERHAA